jgi:hypothetical protein
VSGGAEPSSGRVVGVDADLEVLFAQVEALRELAADPDQAQDRARVYDFSIRWGTFVHGRLERLAYYRHRGDLTAEQQAHYEKLCTQLRQALPVIDRLGLARPGVVLLVRK